AVFQRASTPISASSSPPNRCWASLPDHHLTNSHAASFWELCLKMTIDSPVPPLVRITVPAGVPAGHGTICPVELFTTPQRCPGIGRISHPPVSSGAATESEMYVL